MSGKKILSIEYDAANRKIIFDFLSSKGFEVIEASDGEEGLKKAKTENLNLVLLEIQLPKMDGFSLIKAIRQDSRAKDIPIIVLSSYAMSADADKGYAAGCNAYFAKPYNFEELLGKINELIK